MPEPLIYCSRPLVHSTAVAGWESVKQLKVSDPQPIKSHPTSGSGSSRALASWCHWTLCRLFFIVSVRKFSLIQNSLSQGWNQEGQGNSADCACAAPCSSLLQCKKSHYSLLRASRGPPPAPGDGSGFRERPLLLYFSDRSFISRGLIPPYQSL